jgi:hypothetical protein
LVDFGQSKDVGPIYRTGLVGFLNAANTFPVNLKVKDKSNLLFVIDV